MSSAAILHVYPLSFNLTNHAATQIILLYSMNLHHAMARHDIMAEKQRKPIIYFYGVLSLESVGKYYTPHL